MPRLARLALHGLVAQLRSIEVEIEKIEAENPQVASDQRGEPTAGDDPRHRPNHGERIAASVPDASLFRSGRQFAAGLAGMTPKSNSSGGTERQVEIRKQGHGYLRRLLVIGATAVLRFARQNNPGKVWAARLRAQATEGGRRRTGQQNRADRLAADGPRRHIRGPGNIGGRHYRGSRDVRGC